MKTFNELSKLPKALENTLQEAEKAIEDAEKIVEAYRLKKAQAETKTQAESHRLNESAEPVDEGYILYRDKNENFSCDIDIAGAKLGNTDVRIVIESEEWNLVFPGKIVSGRCIIPLKKLSLFEEGHKGKIKLEVIAEDTLFVPWEENFTVKTSKKVSVSLHEREVFNEFPEEKAKVRIQNIR